MHGTLGWNDKFRALLSAPYITSIILHDRRCWLDQFLPARYSDPAVDEFTRQRVAIVLDPQVSGNSARVAITTRDGRTFEDLRTEARGDPGDPLSWADVVGKLGQAAEGHLDRPALDRMIDGVDRIEHLHDVREWLRILRR
jgi:2-methylcitrate dehydratase PrpD